MSADNNGLIELHLETPVNEDAANGAPAREPEVWDERIAEFNPLFAHAPEEEPVQLSPAFMAEGFSVETYLAEERAKDLLRFSTAGSVDDGKSTLIGRLLYDTASVYDDQIRSIEGKGTTQPGVLDLALLTDGLRAEREQGITIDVAYRYFATARRKFIIADTPGHEQYTRNMATGASTADLAIVLVDARKGVLPQSRRHAAITTLLGVKHIIIAVNKMDLVGYDQSVFERIEADFRSFLRELDAQGIASSAAASLHFVPVSALTGENVVHRAATMPWYRGAPLLELLETLPSVEYAPAAAFRMAVQRVVRPDLDFRGFAGQIASGTIRPGDAVMVQPSGRRSTVRRIVTFDGDVEQASAPSSVTLTLADEIDISRGDLIASAERAASVATRFSASLVWMTESPLALNTRLHLKHTSRTVHAEVRTLDGIVDLTSAAILPPSRSDSLALNGIGIVTLETLLPLAVDVYAENRHTGSFVLIDPQTNGTVAAGMIRSVGSAGEDRSAETLNGRILPEERVRRFGHAGAHITVRGALALAESIERLLFAAGASVVLVEDATQVEVLTHAGLLVLIHEPAADASLQSDEGDLTPIASPAEALASLRQQGIVRTPAERPER